VGSNPADSNAVFVQYTISSSVRTLAQLLGSEHLALLEMRGDQIVKMRDFSADSGNLSPVDTPICAKLAKFLVDVGHYAR
jgi:hypothetical protein